jgi:hypothetical protein
MHLNRNEYSFSTPAMIVSILVLAFVLAFLLHFTVPMDNPNMPHPTPEQH